MAHAQTPDPTEAEIAAMCPMIQATWSEEEKIQRLRADWRPTFVRCEGVREVLKPAVYHGHHNAHDASVHA